MAARPSQMELIRKYFPGLTDSQMKQFSQLLLLYPDLNCRINVISRKDIMNLEERHVVHSLSISRFAGFTRGTQILDAGTGGGFPGIPLAILYPETEFLLVDSIGKKIHVADQVIRELGLVNASAVTGRFENIREKFDFILGRAVTSLPAFVSVLKRCVKPGGNNKLENGILYLKGGDPEKELKQIQASWKIWDISEYFSEEFFQTKKLVHLYRFRESE